MADEAAPAEAPGGCERDDLRCWQELLRSECYGAASTLETCLVFLQRLETTRRASYSSGVTLLLGETLHGLAQKDMPPAVKQRYLERSRAAYSEVVRKEPLKASGYLGLAEVAETGDERVEWLRGAVQAEYQPAHMELLANALSGEGSGHTGTLEAARYIEDAYTYESTDAEKWRYGASAWHRYGDALNRYPLGVTERSRENVVIRVKDDIDYPFLQRLLLDPESDLAHLAGAFAIMCEESIAAIITLDECMAGLELAVATAEGPISSGTRRLLAEAALTGMRTIAGESLPRSLDAQTAFLDWIDRLLTTRPTPVEVSANLFEARADYTAHLMDRADALVSATALSPNRGDLRLKLGATYVDLELWWEALEQLRVAKFLSSPEEHELVDKLIGTADKAYQARFLPPDPTTH
jgi:hypothetical protein